MQYGKRTAILAAAGVGLMIGAGTGRAAVIVTTDVQSASTGSLTEPAYVVANDDLLQTSLLSVDSAGSFTEEAKGGIPVLTNGTIGLNWSAGSTGLDQAASAGGGGPGGSAAGTPLIFTLDTVASPAGYNISNINVYGGWRDQNRDHQKWTVSYSTINDPDAFITLQTVNYDPSHGAGTDVFTSVSLSSDSGPLATNVAKVKFDFLQEGHWAGYSEIDVIGAAVPEPASVGLMAVGALGLMARRRRS